MKTYNTFAELSKALTAMATAWDIEFDTKFHELDIKCDIKTAKELFSDAKKNKYDRHLNLYWRKRGIQQNTIGWQNEILMFMVVRYNHEDKNYSIECSRESYNWGV